MKGKDSVPDCSIASQLLANHDGIGNLVSYFPEKTFYQFSSNQLIFEEGEYPSAVYCLLKGKAKADRMLANQKFTMAILSPGQLCGLQSVINGVSLSYSLTTLQTCTFCAISKSDLLSAMKTDPGFTLQLLKLMHQEISQLEDRFHCFFYQSPRTRTAALILQLSDWFDTDQHGAIHAHLTFHELANLLRISASHFYRIIDEFRQKKHLEVHHQKLKVLNPEGLKHESRQDT